jgi:hypothetical protein
MSELVRFAKAELRAAGMFDADADFDGAIGTNVVALMETFTAYGHSGMSAEVTLAVFNRLASHKPLTPLTGEDNEWTDMSGENAPHGPLWQNNRYHSVFKTEERAWIVHEVSKRPGDRLEYITFPYLVE